MFFGCSTRQIESREISSVNQLNLILPAPEWNFESTNLYLSTFVYTPFFVDQQKLTIYTGGLGGDPKNGILKLTTTYDAAPNLAMKKIIATGPNLKSYNFFRAARVARNGSEIWMLIEVSGCYSGCDSPSAPKSLAVYHSANDGVDWNFINFATVDGRRYVSQWQGHTGLIYNPQGSPKLDLVDLTRNRFITIGENRDIFVSADGVNYKSTKMNHPFAKDRLIFASIAKTPYGYHLMSSSNWSDSYYTSAVRHLFSKDLVNWYILESSSFLKNPDFYKGVHLSYDESSKKLWALSPCGIEKHCAFLAWLQAKDYLDRAQVGPKTSSIPIGEFVYYKDRSRTAMIVGSVQRGNVETYKVRFANGTYDSGYTKDMFIFPLASYTRQGCVTEGNQLCVGDAVYYKSNLASIMGFDNKNPALVKYAIKYSTGVVDTGFTRSMLTLP